MAVLAGFSPDAEVGGLVDWRDFVVGRIDLHLAVVVGHVGIDTSTHRDA